MMCLNTALLECSNGSQIVSPQVVSLHCMPTHLSEETLGRIPIGFRRHWVGRRAVVVLVFFVAV